MCVLFCKILVLIKFYACGGAEYGRSKAFAFVHNAGAGTDKASSSRGAQKER